MLYFYDGQIRRYIVQIARLLSNFVVRYGDGTLVRIPVVYGDADRTAANALMPNPENMIQTAPKMAVYVSDLQLDRNRLGDASYVGKIHIRERDFDSVNNEYLNSQGGSYTVERLMPTPFKLSVKVDILSTSTEQKLQILEQVLVLFNPSLEIQTTDNYVDWTSLSVVDLTNIVFSSRSIPVGTNTAIDIATMTLETPIWITPPAKVKKLGVVTTIISSIFGGIGAPSADYISGLGTDPNSGQQSLDTEFFKHKSTRGNYSIVVYEGCITAFDPKNQSIALNWRKLFEEEASLDKYRASLSKIYLLQQDESEVVGYITIDQFDETCLRVVWDEDTYPTNIGIDSQGRFEDEQLGYDPGGSFRAPESCGTFDAIVDPQQKGPRGSGLPNAVTGQRYLLVEDIGAEINEDGADAWKADDDTDLVAHANDIIEWQEDHWEVIFNSRSASDKLIYQTNLKTLVQYKWDGVQWSKSFEGDYRAGDWRLVL
jgi:hypothetical protein